MTESQRPQHRRPTAVAVAPQKFGSVGRIVTAHTALAEPLITVEGLDAVLAPREAISLIEQLAAACTEVCRHRPDIARRDEIEAAIRRFRTELERLSAEVAESAAQADARVLPSA